MLVVHMVSYDCSYTLFCYAEIVHLLAVNLQVLAQPREAQFNSFNRISYICIVSVNVLCWYNAGLSAALC